MYIFTRLILGPLYFIDYEERVKYLERFIDAQYDEISIIPCKECGKYTKDFLRSIGAYSPLLWKDYDTSCQCIKPTGNPILQ